jgi:SPP1 family predicted phage head-tail adaptor
MRNTDHVRAGNMDQRIRILRPVYVNDELAGHEPATDIGTDGYIWAERLNQVGREPFEGERQITELDTVFRTRHRTDLDEKMRVQHRGSDYDIHSIEDKTGARVVMDLRCQRVK